MNRTFLISTLAALPVTLAVGQQPATAPVRADALAPSVSPQEVTALQQEVARLREEVQQLKTRESGSAAQVKADPAGAPAPLPPQPAVTIETPPAPIAPVAASPLPPGAVVAVSRVSVTSRIVDNTPAIHVVAYVTIQGLPNVPFTFQAALVTPDEKIHSSIRGVPYVATREVSTGDWDDTDDYAVDLSLKDLFTSNPPADLYVQVRIIDGQGRTITKSGLHSFERPWK